MKKVTTRSLAVMLLVAMVVAGLGIYIFRLARDGGDWATFYANDSVYSRGQLNRGVILDRDGVVLATASEDGFHYADDASVRRGCLHVVGDLGGNIGTSVLSEFRPEIVDYSFITGTTTEDPQIQLTIDAEVSAAAYDALSGKKGTVAVYNYKTGEIVCLASTPAWDPQQGVTFDLDDPAYEGAFINRALSSTFTPGSVFKLVTLAAALETIPDIWQQTFYCDGEAIIGSQKVKCTGHHGTITAEQALAHSCNVALGEIARQLGGELITRYAEAYGLTSTHEINGRITAAAGSVPAGTGDGDAAWEGIGQYKDLVNPYAFMRFIGAIANGGICVEPTLLAGRSAGSTRLMPAATAQRLSEMMSYNVQLEYGAGSYPGLEMHAKTGTAEVGDGTTHAWFAGFITNANAPYAFVVMAERAGGGYYVASPIANKVLQKAVAVLD